MGTKRFTDRTYRSSYGDWVKVTRDNKDRTFTHAFGRRNEIQAERIQTLPFKWISNWKEAEDCANRFLAAS